MFKRSLLPLVSSKLPICLANSKLLQKNSSLFIQARALNASVVALKPKTKFNRKVPERKQYLMDGYLKLLEKKALLVYQHNNLTVPEYRILQTMAMRQGFRVQTCRAGLIRTALQPQDLNAMAPLFKGPSLIIHINDPNTSGLTSIELVKNMHDSLAKQDKILFLGAKMDNLLFSKSSFDQLTKLGSLTDLYGQLLGTLQSNPHRLISLLNHDSNMLIQLLKQHSSNNEE